MPEFFSITGLIIAVKESYSIRTLRSPINIAKVLETKTINQKEEANKENKTKSTDLDYDILQYLTIGILSSLDDESIEILKTVGASEFFDEDDQSETTEQPNIQLIDQIYEQLSYL